MKRIISLAGALALANLFASVTLSAASVEEQVAESVKPLPEDLKAGATVYMYDANGDRKILRQGTNGVECSPKEEDGFTRCTSIVTRDRRDFQAKLKAQKKSPKEIQEAVAAATKAGKLKPVPFGTMSYRYSDDDKRIKILWVMSVPGATTETLGVSTTSQRDAALKGHGYPWLMLPGTPGAHVMIPINAVSGSN
jgi:hypothetical protein